MKIEKVEPEALGSEFRTQKQGSMCIQLLSLEVLETRCMHIMFVYWERKQVEVNKSGKWKRYT